MNISPAPANPFGCGRIRRHLAAAFLVAAGLVLSLVAAPPASAASEGTLVLQHDGWGRGFVTRIQRASTASRTVSNPAKVTVGTAR